MYHQSIYSCQTFVPVNNLKIMEQLYLCMCNQTTNDNIFTMQIIQTARKKNQVKIYWQCRKSYIINITSVEKSYLKY